MQPEVSTKIIYKKSENKKTLSLLFGKGMQGLIVNWLPIKINKTIGVLAVTVRPIPTNKNP